MLPLGGIWRHTKTCQYSNTQQPEASKDRVLKFSSGPVQATKLAYSVYKAQKKTGPSWESSYLRFAKGESPTSIALSPTHGGRPLTVTTIMGHIQEAVVQGRAVDLQRLASFSSQGGLPT